MKSLSCTKIEAFFEASRATTINHYHHATQSLSHTHWILLVDDDDDDDDAD